MGRRYNVISENVAVAAIQDLAQILGATGKIVMIRRVKWANTDNALPTAQMLRTTCTYLPATVTNGSGGTTPTPAPIDQGDAAASFTAKTNNTVQATTSGTAVQKWASGDHIQAGLEKTFDPPIPVGPSESFVFSLITAPSSSVHLTTVVECEEIGA